VVKGVTPASPPGDVLDRARYELEVEEAFDRPELDTHIWLPHYLPHWSSRQASAARYDVGAGRLRLRIDADQPPWAPEYDGHLRVSSLQTGLFAGPVGSRVGQLQFRDGLVVREAQEAMTLYAPRYGVFEMRASTVDDPANMVALWMIGLEDRPERSGEICIAEIFGRDIGADEVRVGMGIHPWADPSLVDDFAAEPVAIDARQPHWYAAEWTPDLVAFYVDERLVKTVHQSPSYPMQFMLGIYEFADGPELPPAGDYPKSFIVEAFRGYRAVRGPGARDRAFPADRS
jgi:hypothetical protein